MKPSILNHFKKADPKLYQHMLKLPELPTISSVPKAQRMARLMRNIIFQQLSGKAGATIESRFKTLYPRKRITASATMALTMKQLRSVGLSEAKANYIKNIAKASLNKEINFNGLDKLDNETVSQQLTTIKGVGQWTAEMFLMFALGRENVFSIGDLGLRNGVIKVYGQSFIQEPKLSKLIKRWDPYQSYASLTLWAILDNQ